MSFGAAAAASPFAAMALLLLYDAHLKVRLEQRRKLLARTYADVLALRQRRAYATRLIEEIASAADGPARS